MIVTAAREVTRPGGPRVAANAGDRHVLALEFTNEQGLVVPRLAVITVDGRVFAHDLWPGDMQPYPMAGPPGGVAARPADKRVLHYEHRIMVITADGRVFTHDVHGRSVAAARAFSGPPVGARAVDKWVLAAHRRLLVVTSAGKVFAHDVDLDRRVIGPAYPLPGPRDAAVAAKPVDKWLLWTPLGLLVITNAGERFSHVVRARAVESPRRVKGPPVAAQPHDKRVAYLRGDLFVITAEGRVFAHEVRT